MNKRMLSALLFLIACTASLAADKKNEEPKAAQSVADLRQQLEQILKETHTPGASVAIVRKDGPEWVAGLGTADVASNRRATADTLFRIGSTSKAFVALSILKLAREGKLSLDDSIRKYVPDMTFQNRWEATDPVRVVDLLEHTTGWDDMHLKEYANDAPGIDLRTALAYGAASRVSRWPPGTRMAYCNTGPTVAAYIVEKITGQRFEDYVQQNLFGPIGMKSATYFEPPAGTGTTLYHEDGKTPYRYWNIIYRPAGAINASANDMTPYVQFYLNRGTVNGAIVTPAAEIDRMESPASTWAAKDGLKCGYGLGNYWSIQDGFVYHGHTGGVDGGLTELAYMPEYGVGYFFSINSGNGDAFWRIGKAIRSYITLKLPRPAVPSPAALPSDASDYAGWYEPNAPRQQMFNFMDRIKELARVRFESGKMIVTTGLSRKQIFVPVSGRQFRFVPDDGPPEPVASAALLTPNSEGRFIEAGTTLKHLPAWVACAEVGLLACFDLALIAILIYAPFWIIGGFFKKRRRPAERAMRLYPLVAVLSLVACLMIFNSSGNDYINRLGHLTPWSAGIFLTILAFAVATIMGVWSAATAPPSLVRPAVRWFSIAVSVALVSALVYFAYWGVIGVRTWA